MNTHSTSYMIDEILTSTIKQVDPAAGAIIDATQTYVMQNLTWIIIVAITAGLVLIELIVGCCICCCRGRQSKKENTTLVTKSDQVVKQTPMMMQQPANPMKMQPQPVFLQ